MRGCVEGRMGQKRMNEEGAAMRQEMSQVNKLILSLPDLSHVQLVALLSN